MYYSILINISENKTQLNSSLSFEQVLLHAAGLHVAAPFPQ